MSLGFLNMFHTNQAVQPQRMARVLKVDGLYRLPSVPIFSKLPIYSYILSIRGGIKKFVH